MAETQFEVSVAYDEQRRAYRWRHVNESVLQALFYKNRLTLRQFQAGERLYRDFYCAQPSRLAAIDLVRERVDGAGRSSVSSSGPEFNLEARQCFHAALEVLSLPEQETLKQVVCCDQALSHVDKHRRVRKGTSGRLLRAGLDKLSVHYADGADVVWVGKSVQGVAHGKV